MASHDVEIVQSHEVNDRLICKVVVKKLNDHDRTSIGMRKGVRPSWGSVDCYEEHHQKDDASTGRQADATDCAADNRDPESPRSKRITLAGEIDHDAKLAGKER